MKIRKQLQPFSDYNNGYSTSKKSLETVYQELTGVNISTQKALWNERGKGYYGEFLVFSCLYPYVPGDCKILMNLEIPCGERKTEIDLLLIHETGLYVFEMKHFKGTIYGKGNDATWTQYFRTASNHKFRNPIQQNDYHCHALKKLFPSTPIFSFIVFTHESCELRIEHNHANTIVCKLQNLGNIFPHFSANHTLVWNRDDINRAFDFLTPFAKLATPTIPPEVSPIPFYSQLEAMRAAFRHATNEMESTFQARLAQITQQEKELEEQSLQSKKRVKKQILWVTLCGIFAILLCVAICLSTYNSYNQQVMKLQAETEIIKQHYAYLDEYYAKNGEAIIDVSKLSLKPSSVYSNSTSFSCSLSLTNRVYGIRFMENTQFVVETKSGQHLFPMFGDHLRYRANSQTIGKGYISSGKLQEIIFINIPQEDILSVSVNNVCVWTTHNNEFLSLRENAVLTLYTKENIVS